MNSNKLTEAGLINIIAGSDYNFRSKTMTEADLKENYQRLVDATSIPVTSVYSATQVHGDNIAYVAGTQGEDFVLGKTIAATDGLITDQVGLGLIIKYADCTPIVIYDPVKKVQASVHSGWRGTVQAIGVKAIEKMVKNFGSQLSDLLIYLGPSIDAAHYEVGPEVYEAFANFSDRDAFFTPQDTGNANGKYLLSNIDAIYQSLVDYGIREEQIEKSGLSTFTDDRLHSARQEGLDYGLNAIMTVMV